MSTPDDDPLVDQLAKELDSYYQQLLDPLPPTVAESAPNPSERMPETHQRLERAKRCVDRLALAARRIPEHEDDASDPKGGASESPALATIRRIGRFQILSTLGAGGFGVVYKAFDPRTKREVAVKVPRLEVLASTEMRRRFELEASAAAKLDHPNIISVLEAGDADGVPFIVSPYVEGPTLAHWLKSHNHSVVPSHAALFARQLALAVQHAHDRGVLHRDIKPSNVLLAKSKDASDSGDLTSFTPKLMDFGLAKLAESTETMTGTGMILGTVRYMAPEQARGEHQSITTKTDVYGLGAILFELLAGRAPFDGASDIEVIGKVVAVEPTRIRTIRDSVPMDLETICLKCLEKDPSRRYSSPRELSADLGRYVDGEPIQARPVTTLERWAKWSRRHPSAAALIAVAVVSVLALTAGALWYSAQLARALTRTQASEQRALEREAAARRLAYCADMRLVDQRWNGATYSQLMNLLNRYQPQANQTDVRGFEWWLYWRYLTTDRKWRLLGKHEGGATSVAMAPDSTRAASAGKDGVIRLWSVPEGELLAELRGHAADDIDGLAFSPDGRLLASGANDGEVRIWTVNPPKLIHVLPGHTDWVSSVAFSPDQTMLASAGGDKKILLWDPSTGKQLAELTGHQDTVRSIVFLKKRPLLISASEDATVRAWNTTTLGPAEESFQPIPEKTHWVRQLVVEPDETGLWGVVFNRPPVIWNLRDSKFGQLYGERVNVNGNVLCMAFQRLSVEGSPVFGYENSTLAIKLDYSQEEEHYFGHSSAIRGIAMGQDRWLAITAAADGEILLWDFRVESQALRAMKSPDIILDALISPDGERVCLLHADGGAELLDFDTQRSLATVRLTSASTALTFTPDNKGVWIATSDGRLQRFNSETALLEGQLELTAAAREIGCSPDGRWIVTVLEGGLRLIDARESLAQQTLNSDSEVLTAKFLDSDTILGACEDGKLRVWRTPTLTPFGEVQVSRTPLDSMVISPDGTRIAVGAYQTIWIFDTSFAVVATLPQVGDVERLTWLARGKTLSIVDGNGTTRLWNTSDWQEVAYHNSLLTHLGRSVSHEGFRTVRGGSRYVWFIDARPDSFTSP